jgi:hypothetical protein
MCNYPLMATNLMITLREDVLAAATIESWMSRGIIPPIVEDDNESCEERDFVENKTTLISGIWPPCSYSCDFYKIDFRSAQALGAERAPLIPRSSELQCNPP